MYGAKNSDVLKTYTWDLEKQIKRHKELAEKVWIYLMLINNK